MNQFLRLWCGRRGLRATQRIEPTQVARSASASPSRRTMAEAGPWPSGIGPFQHRHRGRGSFGARSTAFASAIRHSAGPRPLVSRSRIIADPPSGFVASRASGARMRGLEGDERPERRDHARQAEIGEIGDDAIDALVGLRRFLDEQIAVLADDHAAERIAGQPATSDFRCECGRAWRRGRICGRRHGRATPASPAGSPPAARPDRTACRAIPGWAPARGRRVRCPCDAG